MATSIVKNFTSARWYPSANPINATVTSNFNGKCNFRYICDVYVNGTKVYTSKLFPEPSTGYGFFQIGRIIQDYIETLIPKTAPTSLFNVAAESTAPTSALTVYCKFGEEYDSTTTCDGTIVQYNNQATSNTFYVFESAIDYEDFLTFDYTDYYTGTSSVTNFLTNSPRVGNDISYGDSYFLDFMTLQTINSTYKVKISIVDIYGITTDYTIASTTLSARKRYRLAVGPSDINKYYVNTFGYPLITQFSKSYTITLLYNTTTVSEPFQFVLKKPAEFVTRLGFVGLKGGIEHFTFYHRNTKSYEIDRRTFERTTQSNIASDWTYQVGDRGTTTYKVSAMESHRVGTFCSKAHSEWLYEMWLSPAVWTYKRTELIPFRIYREDSTPTSRMLFWLPTGHGLEVGDEIISLPDTLLSYTDFQGAFTVASVEGDNIVDCGLTYNIYNSNTVACGYVQKVEIWQTLPVVIGDNNIEVKQKLTRPIEYSLSYRTAYSKNTLR